MLSVKNLRAKYRNIFKILKSSKKIKTAYNIVIYIICCFFVHVKLFVKLGPGPNLTCEKSTRS